MPAYDFKCTKCGDVVEVTRPASDDSAVACPECGGSTRRVFGPVGVHFKGAGFHATDYKKKGASTEETPSCADSGSKPACSSCPAAE
jgi:putative FmdB family regulatory protein